jgi:predicted RNase H-like HicB family nuclease
MQKYQAVFTQNEDGWWTARCIEIPSAITQGKTLSSTKNNLKSAIKEMIKSQKDEMLKDAKKEGAPFKLESICA